MTASLIIAVLAFGAFAGAATLVTKNQLGITSVSFADDGEDEDEDEDEDKDEDQDEDKSKDKEEKAKEAEKKKAERDREAAKKQTEHEDDDEDENEDEGDDTDEDESDDNDSDEDEGDSEDDADEAEGDDDGDENAMYRDRDKTLSKLQEKLDEARKEIAQKGDEGFDVTAALARLAAAEAVYASVSGAFDANNLDEVKRLTKEARKLTHFARENDLHDAEEAAEDVGKVAKRIVQIKKKLAELKALGGDTASFEVALAETEKMFAEAKALVISGGTDAAAGFAGLDAAERRAKSIKNSVENAIFALGGEDDDFDDDHRSEVADFVKSLNDVADIEGGGIGKQVRTVARAQKLSADKVATLMDDAQARSDFAEFLIGPKTDDLDEIQNEISANNARIAILNSAIDKVEDADVKAILAEQVTALQQETTKLQSFVNSQSDKSGLFGWLSAFFPKF